MLSDINRHTVAGEMKLKNHRSIIVVVNFVENILRKFAKIERYRTIENEKGLTQKFVILLNQNRGNFPFYFHHEYIENPDKGNSPTVDIGTIATGSCSDQSFFSLEAKRLPTPSESRKKEYVYGKGGGIERFKKEIHGKGLSFNAIIGYIQKNDFDYWFKSINTWIDEVGWNEPLVKKSESTSTARYLSEHKRKVDTISLYHLWVKVGS